MRQTWTARPRRDVGDRGSIVLVCTPRSHGDHALSFRFVLELPNSPLPGAPAGAGPSRTLGDQPKDEVERGRAARSKDELPPRIVESARAARHRQDASSLRSKNGPSADTAAREDGDVPALPRSLVGIDPDALTLRAAHPLVVGGIEDPVSPWLTTRRGDSGAPFTAALTAGRRSRPGPATAFAGPPRGRTTPLGPPPGTLASRRTRMATPS